MEWSSWRPNTHTHTHTNTQHLKTNNLIFNATHCGSSTTGLNLTSYSMDLSSAVCVGQSSLVRPTTANKQTNSQTSLLKCEIRHDVIWLTFWLYWALSMPTSNRGRKGGHGHATNISQFRWRTKWLTKVSTGPTNRHYILINATFGCCDIYSKDSVEG